MEILSVKNLKKHFPVYSGLFRQASGYVKALNGIDFSIAEGEIFSLVGESGSGKSTAANLSIRLIEASEGEIYFEGKDLRKASKRELKKVRKDMQIIFQDPYASLNPRKNIFQNISEGIAHHRLANNEEDLINKSAVALEKVGLDEECMWRFPHEFSGGQQQRICIARAISIEPKLLVCDEAVSALDVSVQAQILNLLLDLKEQYKLSYLFISHDLAVVRQISDRVAVMHNGKIVECNSCEALFQDPQNEYTKKLIASIPADFPKV